MSQPVSACQPLPDPTITSNLAADLEVTRRKKRLRKFCRGPPPRSVTLYTLCTLGVHPPTFTPDALEDAILCTFFYSDSIALD